MKRSSPIGRRLAALLLALLLASCAGARSSVAPTPAAPTAAPTPAAPTAAPTPTLGPGMFVNPLIDQDFPDPDVLTVGDAYYVYATNSASINVQVARSDDLVHWRLLGDALPRLPGWAKPGNTWAPEVTAGASGYVMYFAANLAPGQRECIGAATSATPEGPFRPVGDQPLVCQLDRGGSIDPSAFVDADGTHYLLWKNDGNCCGGQTWIFIQPVSADGLTLEGTPTELISADQPWEGRLVEAPTLWRHGATYVLFYSANDYSTPRYAVGYALADHVLGPYQKAPRPLLATSIADRVVGPGGQDVVADRSGQTWMLYHSWEPQSFRSMSIDRLDWSGDQPSLRPSRAPQPGPTGAG